MNRDILELREVITKLVPLLTGKGLIVTQRGSQAYVQTDPVSKRPIAVNIPSISDNASPEFIRAIQGYIDHEVAHVLITDWNYYAGGESDRRKIMTREYQMFQNTHNIVEDTMIEREIVKIFPGSRRNIADLREMFIKDISLPAIKKAGSDPKKAFVYILVPLMRALAGHEEFIQMMDDHKLWDNEYCQGVVKGLKPATLKALKTCTSTKETLEIAKELHLILYPPAPPAPPPPPAKPAPATPPPPAPEPEEEDDEDEIESKSEDKPEKKAEEGDGDGERDHDTGDDEADDEPEASGEEPGDEEPADVGDSDADADADADDEDDAGSGDEDADSGDAGEPDDGDDDSADPAGEDPEDDADGAADEDDSADADADPAGGSGDDDLDEPDDGEDAGSGAGGAGDEGEDDDDDGAQSGPGGHGVVGHDLDEDEAAGIGRGDEDDDGEDRGGGAGSTEDGAAKSIFEFEDDAFDEVDMNSAIAVMIGEEAVDAMNKSDYNVYSREFDRIETAPLPTNIDPEWVPAMDETVKSMIGRLQKDIERLMASQSHVIRTPGHRRGKLHAPSLYRVSQGDDRVFSVKEEHVSKDTAVMLLIDNSGSMHGSKMKTAMLSGYALSSTLDRVNIPHEVIGFTTGDFGDAPESFLDAMRDEVYTKGIHYHRVIPLMMPIYKEFDERLSPAVKQRIAYAANAQRGLSGNIDGECLEYAAARLMKRREKRKVMIVFSDGQPAGDMAGPHLKTVVKELSDPKKFGLDLIGIGIQDSSVKHYYPKHVVLNNVMDLPGQVMQELKKILA